MYELHYATGSTLQSSFYDNIVDAIDDADWMIQSDENVEPISIHEIIKNEVWNNGEGDLVDLRKLYD
jgi:hypothetical protein